MVTAEPWRAKRRISVDDPQLTVGVMVDISGSMGDAMEPMASAAWIISEAVKRVDGRFAMVYYGNSVFPVVRPGQHLDRVRVYTAPDGTEKYTTAFTALDGVLNLRRGSGPRLLFVVSDMIYTSTERDSSYKTLEAAQKDGVATTILDLAEGVLNAREYISRGVTIIRAGRTPEAAAVEIGRLATDALRRAQG